MGIFGRNWRKELDRAEGLLARDLSVQALEIAERVERKADPELRPQASALVLRARGALLTSVLAKADAAEAAGDLEDAADWLSSAVEQEHSAMRRTELEARRQALLDRSYEAESPLAIEEQTVTVVADDGDVAVDASFQYEILTTMLQDEVRSLYEGRPIAFQRAVVDLNEGRTDSALEVLERSAATAPDDAVGWLELGRARLLSGQAAAAAAAFEAAWKDLGDEPLDEGGSTVMPALWAEASLAAGEATAVVERLRPLAAAATGHLEVCRLYATALMESERMGQAVGYLEELTALVSGDAELNFLMAKALIIAGDSERALAGLEQAIEPTCASGGCARPAPHLPSFRLLARLYLSRRGDLERVSELMAWVANAQQGYLGAEDHSILADYYQATGDDAAAADAAAVADRLERAGEGAVAAVEAGLQPGSGRVL